MKHITVFKGCNLKEITFFEKYFIQIWWKIMFSILDRYWIMFSIWRNTNLFYVS